MNEFCFLIFRDVVYLTASPSLYFLRKMLSTDNSIIRESSPLL